MRTSKPRHSRRFHIDRNRSIRRSQPRLLRNGRNPGSRRQHQFAIPIRRPRRALKALARLRINDERSFHYRTRKQSRIAGTRQPGRDQIRHPTRRQSSFHRQRSAPSSHTCRNDDHLVQPVQKDSPPPQHRVRFATLHQTRDLARKRSNNRDPRAHNATGSFGA